MSQSGLVMEYSDSDEEDVQQVRPVVDLQNEEGGIQEEEDQDVKQDAEQNPFPNPKPHANASRSCGQETEEDPQHQKDGV